MGMGASSLFLTRLSITYNASFDHGEGTNFRAGKHINIWICSYMYVVVGRIDLTLVSLAGTQENDVPNHAGKMLSNHLGHI